MLRWVERLEAELAGIDTSLGFFVVIDRTRATMDWRSCRRFRRRKPVEGQRRLRAHEPDTAARVDAAIRAAHERLRVTG